MKVSTNMIHGQSNIYIPIIIDEGIVLLNVSMNVFQPESVGKLMLCLHTNRLTDCRHLEKYIYCILQCV